MKTISKNEVLQLADSVKHTQLFDPIANQYVHGFASFPTANWDYEEKLEPVLNIEGFTDPVEHPAWLSVNHYNAVVLNSRNLLIADIDFGDDRLNRFARVANIEAVIDSFEHLDQLDRDIDFFDVCEFSKQSYRIYRTHSGCRVICTSFCFPFFDCDYEAIRFMRFLRSDPQYIDLCKVQKCYRARLSPKPWRVVEEPAHVCDLIETIGGEIHPDLKVQIDLHDEMTLANETFSCLA